MEPDSGLNYVVIIEGSQHKPLHMPQIIILKSLEDHKQRKRKPRVTRRSIFKEPCQEKIKDVTN